MRRTPLVGAVAVAGTLALVATGAPAHAQSSSSARYVRSCAPSGRTDVMACLALRRTDVSEPAAVAAGQVRPDITVSGYGPADLRGAYKLAANGGAGKTVAIVDAYDDPTAAADLAKYRAQFGLPALTSGQFRKVGQTGGAVPSPDAGWAEEESLDVDMVSAIAPKANIILVEATSATMGNLGTAVNEAVKLGAKYISNSYGGGESSADTGYDSSYFKHPGVAITVSSGDSGYGVEYPAASQYVTAVGGTALSKASNSRGWSETAWNGAGSGCSKYDPKPSWQTAATKCAKRAVADVSAVASPSTGVAVYDSYGGAGGWNVFGGTSVSSPIIAAVYALAGAPGASDYPAGYPWKHAGNLFDVTSGSNGSCTTSVWCKAGAGWDGPTGLGTPNGTGAFHA